MDRGNNMGRSACLIGALVVSAAVAACGSGMAAKGDQAPLVSTVDGMVFQYQLAKSAPALEDTRPLGNTKWRLVSITPKPETSPVAVSMSFQPDGYVVETVTGGGGSTATNTFPYHIVGATLIINKKDNDTNARFRVEGNSLIMDTGECSMLLRRVD